VTEVLISSQALVLETGASGCGAMLETEAPDEFMSISFSPEVESPTGLVMDVDCSWGLTAALGSSVKCKMF
jgi:hypothetical protein